MAGTTQVKVTVHATFPRAFGLIGLCQVAAEQRAAARVCLHAMSTRIVGGGRVKQFEIACATGPVRRAAAASCLLCEGAGGCVELAGPHELSIEGGGHGWCRARRQATAVRRASWCLRRWSARDVVEWWRGGEWWRRVNTLGDPVRNRACRYIGTD